MLSKLLCSINRHRYGEWNYLPSGRCLQTRACRACGRQEERTHHTPTWLYGADNSCEKKWICQRCREVQKFPYQGDTEMRVEHQWVWQYEKSDACEQVATCQRCNAEPITRTEHLFSDWRYSTPVSCDQSRSCSRCGMEEKRTQHQWGDWEADPAQRHLLRSCHKVRSCLRCSRDEKSEFHDFSGGDPYAPCCYICGEDYYNYCERQGYNG